MSFVKPASSVEVVRRYGAMLAMSSASLTTARWTQKLRGIGVVLALAHECDLRVVVENKFQEHVGEALLDVGAIAKELAVALGVASTVQVGPLKQGNENAAGVLDERSPCGAGVGEVFVVACERPFVAVSARRCRRSSATVGGGFLVFTHARTLLVFHALTPTGRTRVIHNFHPPLSGLRLSS